MPIITVHPIGPSVSGVRPGLGWDNPTRGLISPNYFRAAQLLDLNLGAGILKLLLGLFGFLFRDAFLDLAVNALEDLLGIFQAQY